jgi:spore maturation protein CgeB
LKILFAGWHNPNFMSITEYIERALINLGCELKIFEYRSYMIPGRIRDRIKYLDKFDLQRINNNFLDIVKKWRPDLVFVLQGTTLSSETIQTISKSYHTPTVNWFIDYPNEFQTSLKIAKAYDYFFVSSTGAKELHRRLGNHHVQYLPFACDEAIHKPVEVSDSDIMNLGNDVVFVGSHYPEREDLFNNIKEFDLGLWGARWNLLSKDSPLKKFYRGDQIDPKIWVKIYRCSKIILNINMGYGIKNIDNNTMANTRLFEALGCGVLQAVDKKDDILELFEDGKHLVVFENLDELKEKLRYFLDNPDKRSQIADEGRIEALRKHTYTLRMKEMFEMMKL